MGRNGSRIASCGNESGVALGNYKDGQDARKEGNIGEGWLVRTVRELIRNGKKRIPTNAAQSILKKVD